MIEPIGAPDDPRLDPYRKVGDPHWLLTRELFVAEGRLVVSRLVDAGGFEVGSVLVTPAALASTRPASEWRCRADLRVRVIAGQRDHRLQISPRLPRFGSASAIAAARVLRRFDAAARA